MKTKVNKNGIRTAIEPNKMSAKLQWFGQKTKISIHFHEVLSVHNIIHGTQKVKRSKVSIDLSSDLTSHFPVSFFNFHHIFVSGFGIHTES